MIRDFVHDQIAIIQVPLEFDRKFSDFAVSEDKGFEFYRKSLNLPPSYSTGVPRCP